MARLQEQAEATRRRRCCFLRVLRTRQGQPHGALPPHPGEPGRRPATRTPPPAHLRPALLLAGAVQCVQLGGGNAPLKVAFAARHAGNQRPALLHHLWVAAGGAGGPEWGVG